MISPHGLIKLLNTEVRTCPVCEAPFISRQVLCSYCARLVLLEVQRSPPVCHKQNDLSIYSLFLWDDSSRGIIKHVLYKLKQGYSPQVQEWLARLFYLKYAEVIPQESRIFVPAPSKKKSRKKDHAELWAKALAEIYSQSFWYNPLDRLQGGQKLKSVEERRRAKLEFSKQRISRFYGLRKSKTLVFCDDVLTSGSTAKAAHSALGKPENFEVWTLACRAKIFR